MNIEKVAAVIKAIWPYSDTSPEGVARTVAHERELLASPSSHPGQVEVARRILAAADEVPPAPAPAPVAPPAPEAARESAEDSQILGLDRAGHPVTIAAFREKGGDWGALASLTPVGTRCKAAFQEIAMEPLLPRAAELKIDVPLVLEWAARANLHPVKALQAEVEIREQAARDLAALAQIWPTS